MSEIIQIRLKKSNQSFIIFGHQTCSFV